MIQANEVRIGNLLLSGGVVVTIDARSIFNIWDVSKKYDPIPITPEWLERLGFEKREYASYGEYIAHVPNDYGGHIIGSDYGLENQFKVRLEGCDEGRVGIYLEYIHQLQNLYFALTGTELTTRSR